MEEMSMGTKRKETVVHLTDTHDLFGCLTADEEVEVQDEGARDDDDCRG